MAMCRKIYILTLRNCSSCTRTLDRQLSVSDNSVLSGDCVFVIKGVHLLEAPGNERPHVSQRPGLRQMSRGTKMVTSWHLRALKAGD